MTPGDKLCKIISKINYHKMHLATPCVLRVKFYTLIKNSSYITVNYL